MTDETARDTGAEVLIVGAVIAALAAGGYLLWRTIKSIGDTVENATGAVGDVVEVAKTVTSNVSSGTKSLLDPRSVGNYTHVDAEKQSLILQLVGKPKSKNTAHRKETTATFRVLKPDGSPAVNAKVTGVLSNKFTSAVGNTGHQAIHRYTTADGTVTVKWSTANLSWTKTEDDRTFVANLAGYNTSNRIPVN